MLIFQAMGTVPGSEQVCFGVSAFGLNVMIGIEGNSDSMSGCCHFVYSRWHDVVPSRFSAHDRILSHVSRVSHQEFSVSFYSHISGHRTQLMEYKC